MKLVLKNVRISFPHLFTPNPRSEQNKYDGSFIFPKSHEAFAAVTAAIEETGKLKWANKWPIVKKSLSSKGKLVLHDGEEKSLQYDGYEGMMYFNASSKVRPIVKDRKKNDISESDNIIYSGCKVNVVVDIFAGTHAKSGDYVSASLLGVQFFEDDAPFSGGARVDEDDFEALSNGADADDIC